MASHSRTVVITFALVVGAAACKSRPPSAPTLANAPAKASPESRAADAAERMGSERERVLQLHAEARLAATRGPTRDALVAYDTLEAEIRRFELIAASRPRVSRETVAYFARAREEIIEEFGAVARMEPEQRRATQLLAEARANAARGPTRSALAAYAIAENEVTEFFFVAAYGTRVGGEAIDAFTRIRNEVVAESDALALRVFTPDAIEATPWTDLVAGDMAGQWRHDGFKSWQIKDGVIRAQTTSDGDQSPMMTIGDTERWRDFLFECDLRVPKGVAQIYFRSGDLRTRASTAMSVTGEPLESTAPHLYRVSMIGSSMTSAFNEERMADHVLIGTETSRRGAIGIELLPDSEAVISKMRIKVLR